MKEKINYQFALPIWANKVTAKVAEKARRILMRRQKLWY